MGWGGSVSNWSISREEKSWFIRIMIYAQGGGLLKASVTHLSLGLEGFFLCLLLCSFALLSPDSILFHIYHVSYIQYIAMLCIPKPMNVSIWSTVGFFVAHDFQGCLFCVCPCVCVHYRVCFWDECGWRYWVAFAFWF